MAHVRKEASRPRSPLAIVALALVAVTTAAGCDYVPILDRAPASASQLVESVTIDAPVAALAPAVRVNPTPATVAPSTPAPQPVPVVTAGPSPAPNTSKCRRDLAGAVMTITMPEIAYSCPVYLGGQKTLDAGAVTMITDASLGDVLADHPGDSGTLWIAGHHSSHGGAFAKVPNLSDGSIITVSDGVSTASYTIVGRVYVHVVNDRVVDASGRPTGAATVDAVFRTDHGAGGVPRLLLQTCDGQNQRWLIYADLVG